MLSVGVSKRVEFTVNVNKTNVDKLFNGATVFLSQISHQFVAGATSAMLRLVDQGLLEMVATYDRMRATVFFLPDSKVGV